MYKFKSSACKTVGEKLQTKLCAWTDRGMDRQTAMAIPVYPLHFVVGGIKIHTLVCSSVYPMFAWMYSSSLFEMVECFAGLSVTR